MITDWFFSLVDSYMHSKYGNRKARLLSDHPAKVVELGAGYGANFRYLNKDTEVVAIEPKKEFHNLLKRRAKHFGNPIQVFETGGEHIPLPDESVEMVLCSLVLCSVEDPTKVLAEVKRILKPGGRFIFVEHVSAHSNSWLCKLQLGIKRPWKKFFDGCHVDRDTAASIRSASFREVKIDEFSQRTIILPIIPHISGYAVK